MPQLRGPGGPLAHATGETGNVTAPGLASPILLDTDMGDEFQGPKTGRVRRLNRRTASESLTGPGTSWT